MLSRLLPKQIDNDYRGYRFAIWLLGAILLLRLGMSYGALFDPRDMIRNADSSPRTGVSPLPLDPNLVIIVALLIGLGLSLAKAPPRP